MSSQKLHGSIINKRSSRRSTIEVQSQLRYASQKEECLHLISTHVDKLLVFIFIAEWCPHSRELRKHLETLAKDEERAILVLIDVDEAEGLVPFYSLFAVPSFYFFKQDAEIGIEVGGDIFKLRTFIKKYQRKWIRPD